MKDARDILVKSAAGDMGHAVYIAVADDIENLFYVYPCRGKSHLSEYTAPEFRI